MIKFKFIKNNKQIQDQNKQALIKSQYLFQLVDNDEQLHQIKHNEVSLNLAHLSPTCFYCKAALSSKLWLHQLTMTNNMVEVEC